MTFRKRFAKAKDALLEHAYLITLGAIIAVIAASAMYTHRIQAAQSAQAAAGAPEVESSAAAPTASPAPSAAVTPLPTIAPLTVHPVSLHLGGATVYPLSGEVLRGDDAQALVHWAALDSYRVHRGVDVAGKAGESVLCIMDGVVERVWQDALWGTSVRVAQTDGSTATYAGLMPCALTAGQSVTRGQEMAALMEAVPCEAELGPHLHLTLERGGAAEDPALLLKNAQRR